MKETWWDVVFDLLRRMVKTFVYICAWAGIVGVLFPIAGTIYLILSIIDTWFDTKLADPFIDGALKRTRE